MLRSLYSGVSGMKVHQSKMDAIGNNIANVNTVGFKSSQVTFSDVFRHYSFTSMTVTLSYPPFSSARSLRSSVFSCTVLF